MKDHSSGAAAKCRLATRSRISRARFLRAVFVTLAILSLLNLTIRSQAFAKGGRGNPDGTAPLAGLITDASGNLYGTTFQGGSGGDGTVFKLTPPAIGGGSWTESILLNFSGTNGSSPAAALIKDATGNLYGTTTSGGAANQGTVFKLIPPAKSGGSWTESILLSFNGTDGNGPHASLIMDGGGNLYGTTRAGGAYGDGTVFELLPPARSGGSWTEAILHSFDGSDGFGPNSNGLVMDSSGNLYGTTIGGGANNAGTVFELVPSGGGWTEAVLLSFNGADGKEPFGGLVMSNGNLYGTTEIGGAGYGTVFELTPAGGGGWNEAIPFNFNSTDGAEPVAALVADTSGNLYGTTWKGGTTGAGTVFELVPAASESVLHNFGSANDGYGPEANLLLDPHGNLYGTTSEGGTYGWGTVFELTPDGAGGWTESILWSFNPL